MLEKMNDLLQCIQTRFLAFQVISGIVLSKTNVNYTENSYQLVFVIQYEVG